MVSSLFEEAWQREQRRHRRWLTALAILIAGGAFVVAVTGGGGNGAAPPGPSTVLRLHDPARSTQSSPVASRFALFKLPPPGRAAVRRSVANYRGLAGWVTGHNGGMGGQQFGVRYADTYVVRTAGGTVWVIPGRTGACIALPDGASAAHGECGPLTSGFHAMWGFSSGSNGTQPTWYGLVPNNVKRLIVTYASGPRTTVTITNNTFLIPLHTTFRNCRVDPPGIEARLAVTSTLMLACGHRSR
jgi:hypothetical protein